MLIQMPRASAEPAGSQGAQVGDAFEQALRRDLASAPVISYESVIGGVGKRALDLAITILSAPLWLPALLATAAWAKVRHPSRVFLTDERIGYGGAAFQCFSLRVDPPTAVVERLHVPGDTDSPANDWEAAESDGESPRAKWRRALERLPRLFNVLRGDMSLVGPSPLSREQLEPLKTSKRHYLSARPGVVGINALVDADAEDASQYKIYNLSWSLMTDALILWDAFNHLLHRGDLWKPTVLARLAPQQEPDVVEPRRQSGDAA